MDKFYFPMETMRITQNPYGDKSHHKHNQGKPKDYPIDCAGVDGGRSAIFCPTEMKVTAIRGTGSGVTNTIWLVSTHVVKTPTFEDVVFMTCTHWNDKDGAIAKHNKVGSIIKKGEIICYEGTDGADANHIHICCGKGYSDNWVENSKGSWVMTGDNKPPEEVMYIYDKFTTAILDKGNLKWKTTDTDTYDPIVYVGKPVPRNTSVDQIKVKVPKLRARNTPSLKGDILGLMNEGFYDIQDQTIADNYTWYKVQDMWIAYDEQWEDILPHEETKVEIQIEYMNRILEHLPKFLEDLIEKN